MMRWRRWLAVVGGSMILPTWAWAQEEAPAAPEEAGGLDWWVWVIIGVVVVGLALWGWMRTRKPKKPRE
jgi:hypothetical protein